MKVNECSGRALAFLGDAVWSLAVRKYLLEKGEGKGKEKERKRRSTAQKRFERANGKPGKHSFGEKKRKKK